MDNSYLALERIKNYELREENKNLRESREKVISKLEGDLKSTKSMALGSKDIIKQRIKILGETDIEEVGSMEDAINSVRKELDMYIHLKLYTQLLEATLSNLRVDR